MDAAAEPLRLRFDAFELDEADARLTCDGQPVALPPKAFGVLCTLARTPAQLVTKDALLDAVWGHRHVSESVLKSTISELRAALADDARKPRYIETAARRGYRFIGAPPSSRAQSPSTSHAPRRDFDDTPAAPQAPMIGRTAALARLGEAWQHAATGRRQIFWIAGEAGVGKTTLIDRFVAEQGAVRIARGQCVEQYGSGEPYLPVLEALGSLCRNDPALPALMRSVAPTWLLQLPWLGSGADRQALRAETVGANQDRMLREFGELLERYTQQQPLLLVAEDLHWGDHATLRLLDHIARRRQPARLMWLGSLRLAEVVAAEHPLKGLRHELKLHRLCDEIVLDPFSEREVADYLQTRFPESALPEAFVQNIHAHTDGLPLFVVNVIDDLVSQGALQADAAGPPAAAQAAALHVPENLAGVIEKQIERLPAEMRPLLEAAAVCGVEFRRDTLAAAMERDAAWVGERCDTLVRHQHWLNPLAVERGADGLLDARYAFRHALYRRVFYQRIGALARAHLHHRVAQSLERAGAGGHAVAAAELAFHYELGHDLAAALHHYAEAAKNALRHFAPMEAVTLTRHALNLLPRCPDSRERLRLELALVTPRAMACTQVLGIAAPETKAAFERAYILCDQLPASAARTFELSGLGWVYFAQGEYREARALAARIEALATGQDDRLLHVAACNLTGTTATHQGELAAARHWLEQGMAAFEEVKERMADFPTVIDFGVSMGARLSQSLAHMGLVDSARMRAEAALARARALGEPYAEMLALFFAGLVDVRTERPAQAKARAVSIEAIVARHGFVQGEGLWRWLLGWAQARDGQAQQGHTLMLEGYAFQMRQHMLAGAASVLGFACEAMILAQRWADAQKHADDAIALAAKIGERVFLPDLYLYQGRIALARADRDRAREAMRAALAEARAQQAAWVELCALVALCELPDRAPADFAALADTRARQHEGLDTPLVCRADALLRAGPASA